VSEIDVSYKSRALRDACVADVSRPAAPHTRQERFGVRLNYISQGHIGTPLAPKNDGHGQSGLSGGMERESSVAV
jgi:hypothetical protein